MSTDNLDAADLGAATFGGLINESVLQQIIDISNIPLPFTDRIGSQSSGNQFREWTIDALASVDVTNAVVDGSDSVGDDTNLGTRVGNRHQILVKDIAVSTRARSVDTIGFTDTLAYQVMMRTREIRRDLEAISLENQASVIDDGDSVPGLLGGLGSWLETNTFRGATGADGGFDTGTGLTVEPTAGTARALTETLVRDLAESIWLQGGNPTVLMSTPDVIRGLSEFMFSSSARIATLRRETGPGVDTAEAIGSVNIFLTDFEVQLSMIANRLQQTYTDAVATQVSNVYGLDMELLAHSWLHQWRADPLGKPGLSDKRQISGDVTLMVLNEAGLGTIADVDGSLAVTV
jgi:hypothetical protein